MVGGGGLVVGGGSLVVGGGSACRDFRGFSTGDGCDRKWLQTDLWVVCYTLI